MSSQFLEEQAKARGITVSEMMRQRGLKADRKKAGFRGMNPKLAAQARAKSIAVRQANAAENASKKVQREET